jgi:YggT family protein
VAFLALIVQLYVFAILARIALSWFPSAGEGGLATAQRVVYAVTEPVLGPVRALLPPVRMGAAAFDLSPIVVIVLLQVLLAFLR